MFIGTVYMKELSLYGHLVDRSQDCTTTNANYQDPPPKMAVERLSSTQLEYSKPFLERIRPNFGLRHLDTCGSRIRVS
jgi:hypothetical protein